MLLNKNVANGLNGLLHFRNPFNERDPHCPLHRADDMHPVYFMEEVYLLTWLVLRVDHKMGFRLEIELKSVWA